MEQIKKNSLIALAIATAFLSLILTLNLANLTTGLFDFTTTFSEFLIVGTIIAFVLYYIFTQIKLTENLKIVVSGFLTPIVYNFGYLTIFGGNIIEQIIEAYPIAIIDSVLLGIFALGLAILIKNKFK